MGFSCQNQECSMAIAKAVFPSEIKNCPVCSLPLFDPTALNDEEIQLIRELPYVIAYPLRQALQEKHAWTKINLLKDTFLNYLKYTGLITASEFFNSQFKDRNMVALFHKTIAEPSFGSWNEFIRETIKYLKEEQHTFFDTGIFNHYERVETSKRRKLFNGEIEYSDINGDIQLKRQEATAIGMLINFRNRYLGHGLTLNEITSQKIWQEYYPIFKYLLTDLIQSKPFPMFKHEHGETYLLKSAEIHIVEKGQQQSARVWIENQNNEQFDILPFYIVPGEVSVSKEDKEQIFIYESHTGKTIKFFSPEGTEKQTSGKVLERLNLLLREKRNETSYSSEEFDRNTFINRIAAENKLVIETLINEKKVLPEVYVNRKDLEAKLHEWIGAQASIFFIAAEAGSGKTNLLAEIQRQYNKLDLPCLLIRAGRMEKQTLTEQIAFVLNINPTTGLEEYQAIAGSQDKPTVVLIDGLNEAINAEEVWEEILAISKIFNGGTLKFVVTSRANTGADIHRFKLNESDQELLFGDNPEGETGLHAYINWLTAMNMVELQEAWNIYTKKNKNKFNPRFTFSDIADFDRSIYNQINNPLVLRLFLETYHQKTLPKNSNKYLNIWRDWLESFSAKERVFMELLVEAVWEKGENELLLDDLINSDRLKPYFNSDVQNDPYPRLKNLGWLSRYTKDLHGYVSFTVEGALLYMLGEFLRKQKPAITLNSALTLLSKGTKLKRFALEAMLCEQALDDNFTLTTELIDAGNNHLEVCIKPSLLYLKTFGVSKTLNKLLQQGTANDWKVMLEIDSNLSKLRLHTLRKEFLTELMKQNEFRHIESVWLGLIAIITYFDKKQAVQYLAEIHKSQALIESDHNLLSLLGKCVAKYGKYDQALVFYHKSLDIKMKLLGENDPSVSGLLNNIALALVKKEELDKALEFYQKSVDLKLKRLGGMHPSLSTSYSNIGAVWRKKGEYEKALSYYEKSIYIKLKVLGEDNNSLAPVYNNVGFLWADQGKYDLALEWYSKSLKIKTKNFGTDHFSLASSYRNIGSAWRKKGEYDKAVEFYEKSLDLKKKFLGNDHTDVADILYSLGDCYQATNQHPKAIDHFSEAFELQKKGKHLLRIGECHESLNNAKEALKFYILAAETFKNDQEFTISHNLTRSSIEKAMQLSKELQSENELPVWMLQN